MEGHGVMSGTEVGTHGLLNSRVLGGPARDVWGGGSTSSHRPQAMADARHTLPAPRHWQQQMLAQHPMPEPLPAQDVAPGPGGDELVQVQMLVLTLDLPESCSPCGAWLDMSGASLQDFAAWHGGLSR